jgi:peptide deformylase
VAIREILQLGNPLCGNNRRPLTSTRASKSVRRIVTCEVRLPIFGRDSTLEGRFAAPQIGVQRRVLMVTLAQSEALINPEIVRASSEND